jgi:hypothetical protein
MTREPESSAVRAAADLFAAAEELLATAPDPNEAADCIEQLAKASKALTPRHLDEALEHVTWRAARVSDLRPKGLLTFDAETPPPPVFYGDDSGPSTSGRDAGSGWSYDPAKDRRIEAAVDELVDASDDEEYVEVDPEALRARVHGDADDG